MEKSAKSRSVLWELEMEVEEEGREWKRQRLEEKLKRLATKQGEVSPPEPKAPASRDVACDEAADV
jgi:hypothetical protein